MGIEDDVWMLEYLSHEMERLPIWHLCKQLFSYARCQIEDNPFVW